MFVLIVLIPAVATQRQTATSVFTTFNKPTGVGIDSSPYIFLLGLLMSQYTITGYDASAHMVFNQLCLLQLIKNLIHTTYRL